MENRKLEKYLTLSNYPSEIRSKTIFQVLILSDFLGFFLLVGLPELSFILNLVLIPVITLNFWALLYIIAPYRFELSFVLFNGFWGFVTSFIYFLVTQKYIYNILEFESLLFFNLGLSFYFLSVLSVLVIQHLLLNDKIKIPEGLNAWSNWISIVPYLCFGFVELIFIATKSDDIKPLIFVGVVLVVMVFPVSTVKLIHQYIYLRKYQQEVKAEYQDLGKPKKDRMNYPEFYYEVIILDSNEVLSDEEIEAIVDKIGERVVPVDLSITTMSGKNITEEKDRFLKKRVNPEKYPYFLITRGEGKELNKIENEYKQNHQIRNFFKMIQPGELHFATENYMLDFDRIIYHSDNINEIIDYLIENTENVSDYKRLKKSNKAT